MCVCFGHTRTGAELSDTEQPECSFRYELLVHGSRHYLIEGTFLIDPKQAECRSKNTPFTSDKRVKRV